MKTISVFMSWIGLIKVLFIPENAKLDKSCWVTNPVMQVQLYLHDTTIYPLKYMYLRNTTCSSDCDKSIGLLQVCWFYDNLSCFSVTPPVSIHLRWSF